MPDDGFEDKPPYLSLTTILNFLDKWGSGPIPPRIDKSALENYSGATQAQLLGTLRLMGFIDSEGQVLNPLRNAVRSEEHRKSWLDQWARQFYAKQIDLAEQSATAGMLHESFAAYGYNGSTLRKAVVFYLALVDYLDLPTSTHFRPPKQSGTPTTRRRKAPPPKRVSAPADPVVPAAPRPQGETTVITVGDLATITVIVDAQWVKLPIETITTIKKAIDDLEALGDGRDGGADRE